MSSMIYVTKLRKVYNRGKHVVALDNVSFQIEEGTICGLLGKNGAGKTTLIKCMTGLVIPEQGDILIDGDSVLKNNTARLKKVSVVLDGGRNLFSYMTVEENLKYFMMLRNKENNIRSDKVIDILETLKIKDILKRQIQTLSFGMRQRASIAVALACNTKVICLDEPTMALDIEYQNELSNLLKILQNKYNCTIIVSSHDMGFIEKTCSHCILIDHGKIMMQGKIDNFVHYFSSDQYDLKWEGRLSESIFQSLNKELNVVCYDKEQNKLSIAWDRTRNLCELFLTLCKHGIAVYDIEKLNNLATVISMMTNEGEK